MGRQVKPYLKKRKKTIQNSHWFNVKTLKIV